MCLQFKNKVKTKSHVIFVFSHTSRSKYLNIVHIFHIVNLQHFSIRKYNARHHQKQKLCLPHILYTFLIHSGKFSVPIKGLFTINKSHIDKLKIILNIKIFLQINLKSSIHCFSTKYL